MILDVLIVQKLRAEAKQLQEQLEAMGAMTFKEAAEKWNTRIAEDPRIALVEQWRQQTALGRSDETAREMLARLDILLAEGRNHERFIR